ncbi:hypothetical protein BH10PLA2_BH10PLA2_16120 [soil metagenome]
MFHFCYRFQTTSSLADHGDFVVPIEVDVMAYGDEVEFEYRFGYFAIDRILWQKAIDRGISLFEVCDGDSQGMYEMHEILTNNSGDIRKDFKLDAEVEEVLFVHGMVIHPELAEYRTAILNAAMEPLSGRSLETIWQETCSLRDKSLYSLGFRKIAGKPLFARHWTFRNEYSEANPNGLEGDFIGTPEHHEWTAQELKNRYGIGTSEDPS